MGKVHYVLDVVLEERDAKALPSGSGLLSDEAADLLEAKARGGVMVPGPLAKRIEAAIGGATPDGIVEAVEKSAGRDGEATLVYWRVDPTQISFYRYLAENNNLSLEMQLKTLLDYAYEQGWFGMAAPDANKLLLTPEQYRYLQAKFKKDIVTGEDVFRALRSGESLAPAAESEDEDDVVLQSLRGKK